MTLAAKIENANNTLGGLYMLAAVLAFSINDAMAKWLAAVIPVHEILFFRSAFALLPILVLVWRAGGWRAVKTNRPWLHFARGAVGVTAMWFFYFSFANMNLADAKAILYSAPLFLTVLSIFFLSEKVGWFRWTAVAVGFTGVLLVVDPSGASLIRVGALAAVAGAILYAIAVVAIRHLSVTDSAVSISFYFTVLGTIVGLGLVLIFGWVQPTPVQFWLLVAVGITGGLGQYFMTLAFHVGEASAVAPLDYTSMAFAILLGYVIWGEVPTVQAFIGIALVVGAGLFILYRESRLARKRVASKRAALTR